MPIQFTPYDRYSSPVSAEWTYVPNEDLDFSRFRYITCLYIYADRINNDPLPYVLPSLQNIFTNLTFLRIGGKWGSNTCFIGGITDIPSTVTDILIRGTYITDVASVFNHGTNLTHFDLRNNAVPISMSSAHLPTTRLIRFSLYEVTVVDDIIFPRLIQIVELLDCRISRLRGLENANANLSLLIENCVSPYDNNILSNLHNSTIDNIQHITEVNAHHIYMEFGSIPKRINLANIDPHVDNPIVTAMFLSSNYPRRMAEFVAVTEVNTVFEPHAYYQNPHPEDHENEEVYDEENAPNVDDAAYDY
jgi:hypothetical protein